MARLPKIIILALAVVCSCWAVTGWSDQNDPRLDDLFEELQTTSDQETANLITDEIWEIWRESPDEYINELMKQGVRRMNEGELRKAEAIFDEIVIKAPDFAEGWNKRATIYFLLQDYEKSALDIRQTLSLEPRHFGAVAGLGLIFLQFQYYESALGTLKQALDINPHLDGPRDQIERLKEILELDPI